jgi:Zn finger protein HypA/HybF involved in hydrogenase expression
MKNFLLFSFLIKISISLQTTQYLLLDEITIEIGEFNKVEKQLNETNFEFACFDSIKYARNTKLIKDNCDLYLTKVNLKQIDFKERI